MASESNKQTLSTRMARWLHITCEDTTPLVSELMDHQLPLGKKLRLRVHLGMCGVCRAYKKQLAVIRAVARRLGGEDAPTRQGAALSANAKSRIKKALDESN